MNAILLESESSENLNLLLALAEKLGVKTRKISNQQWEDHKLATEIDLGMKTPTVNREEIMKALGE